MGGGPVTVQVEHVALTRPRHALHNPHRFDALKGTACGVLTAANKQGYASQRRPALPILVRMVGQRVQDALGGHIL